MKYLYFLTIKGQNTLFFDFPGGNLTQFINNQKYPKREFGALKRIVGDLRLIQPSFGYCELVVDASSVANLTPIGVLKTCQKYNKKDRLSRGKRIFSTFAA